MIFAIVGLLCFALGGVVVSSIMIFIEVRDIREELKELEKEGKV